MLTPSVNLPTLWQTSLHRHSLSSSLSSLWSLLMFSLVSLVHSGEYMTVSRSSAIVNITYYNPVTDSIYSEVRRLLNFFHIGFIISDRKLVTSCLVEFSFPFIYLY